MLIAITGASGFIGSHLVKALSKKYQLRLLVRNSNIPNTTNKNLEIRVVDFESARDIKHSLQGVDILYHLAGLLPNAKVPDSEYFQTNSLLVKRLAKVASIIPTIKQFVYCSTAYVAWDSLLPATTYEKSKLRGEDYLKEISSKTKLPFIIIRPGFVYGGNGSGLLSLAKTIKSKHFFYFGLGNHFFEITFLICLLRN